MQIASRRRGILAVRSLSLLTVTLLVGFFTASVQTAGDREYEVTDLGTLGGATVANYINNRGDIVGTSRLANGFQHAFLYSEGVMQDLGTLGGTESLANIINDRGQVAGASNLPNGTRHGFLYDKGVLRDLGAFPGSTFSAVFGLNNRGQLFGGSALPGSSVFHAVTFGDDGVVDLGTLGGPSSFAVRVSDVGAATGRADLASGLSRAFFYYGGVMQDVGLLPGDAFSQGRDLNNRGEVVAQSCNASACRGFLWWNGEMIELGSLGGTQTNPLDINDRGQVVGASRTPTSGAATHAFLWEDGVIVDLNDRVGPGSGWVLQSATSINASGQIVGNGTLNGLARAFVLTPLP